MSRLVCELFPPKPLPKTDFDGGARGVVVIAVGNEHGDTSSNPGRDFSHSTNTLGKGMNPIILPPAMDK